MVRSAFLFVSSGVGEMPSATAEKGQAKAIECVCGDATLVEQFDMIKAYPVKVRSKRVITGKRDGRQSVIVGLTWDGGGQEFFVNGFGDDANGFVESLKLGPCVAHLDLLGSASPSEGGQIKAGEVKMRLVALLQ
jgi:hypothetical protein